MKDTESIGSVSLKEYVEGLCKGLDEKISSSNKLFDEKYSHLEDMISHVEKLQNLTQSSAREAILKSEDAVKTHFASVNEFNDRMKTVVTERASQQWAEGFEKSTDARIKALESKDSQGEGLSQGIRITAGFLISALTITTLVISLVVFVSKFAKF
jgi:uncharacterized protein YhaN